MNIVITAGSGLIEVISLDETESINSVIKYW